jgi:hypothetical protein
VLVALLAPWSAPANIGASNAGGSGCGGCHGPVAGGLSVSLFGSAAVRPSASNMYTLSIGGVKIQDGGFSLETDAGTLSVVDGHTQMTGAMVTHSERSVAAPAGNIDDWSYDFDFTAPASIGTAPPAPPRGSMPTPTGMPRTPTTGTSTRPPS